MLHGEQGGYLCLAPMMQAFRPCACTSAFCGLVSPLSVEDRTGRFCRHLCAIPRRHDHSRADTRPRAVRYSSNILRSNPKPRRLRRPPYTTPHIRDSWTGTGVGLRRAGASAPVGGAGRAGLMREGISVFFIAFHVGSKAESPCPDACHGPRLPEGGGPDQAQCDLNLNRSPLWQYYPQFHRSHVSRPCHGRRVEERMAHGALL